MGGEKNKSKRKEKNKQRLGECGVASFKYSGCKKCEEEDTDTDTETDTEAELGGREEWREGDGEVSH
jgi:hypothetical protein